MKKTFTLIVLLTILVVFSFKTHQQAPSRITEYYYFQGQKFYYSFKSDMIFVKFKQDFDSPQQIEQVLRTFPEIDASKTFSYNERAFVKTKTPMNEDSYLGLIDRLSGKEEIESAGYTFTPLNYDDENTFYGMSNEFIVQFKNYISADQIQNINIQNKVEIIEQINVSGGPTYLMRVRNDAELNAIDMSNKYYLDGVVNYAEPDLYCTNTLCDTTNDAFFGLQWAIRNLGNNVPTNPPNVIADCDMDVDSAWNISKGDSTIKICVIDTGVDTNHLDLVNNMTHGLGWDYADNDPWPYDQGSHGTQCASISAAQGDNTIGLAGVAFKCKIIPIRAIGGISAYHGYANSFIRAWTVGADVITNSWGQVDGASSLLFNAISDAARFGRGGKGCVICFASGNENGTMRFPAIVHPDVIVVGGLAPCNKRKSPTDGCSNESWGASYGSNLDLVSPCVKIYAATVGGGYTNSFNGTSSATPNAAGVCALLISANPNLTRLEVESYLYLTCEKVGAYNYDSVRTYGMWNNEMGYGRINARLAMNLMLTSIDKAPPVIYHDSPVLSSPSTVVRLATAIIKDNRKVATGSNAPRLYFRVNGGSFNFVNAFQVAADTFRFNIPGQVAGSLVEYYFAAQDTVSPANISTLPSSGSGTNPPGTTPPSSFFSYSVGNFIVSNSTATPKLCPNSSTIYDTIIIPQFGTNPLILDVNVKVNISHRTDSDVDLFLRKASQQSELTTDNGGSGDSYVNTIFDDSSVIPIISGTAPFTGSFRPETPLTVFNTELVYGTWILQLTDDAAGDFGTLDSWTIAITYDEFVGGIQTAEIPSRFALHQNYPNPFNPVTKIIYDVPKESF
ncbi:MAG: S8 family serine peptidase, partial [Chlorobi bacterium]|nr:S8 family serine peptidase [Chlorobiota bacterium]